MTVKPGTAVVVPVPPQNLDAEQSVLGSMLLDRDAIARVMELLRPEDFYRDRHRTIYVAMLDVFERGDPVDLVTVTNRLSGMGKLDDVGGPGYLAELPNTVPAASGVDVYAAIVREKAVLRALIAAGSTITAMGYEGGDDIAALVDRAEGVVLAVGNGRRGTDSLAVRDLLREHLGILARRYETKGAVTGVATGLPDVDAVTAGLQRSDLAIIASRPSMGKTALMTTLSMHAARQSPVYIFSLEMSRGAILDRMLAAQSGIDHHKIRTGMLSDPDWRALGVAMAKLSELPIYLDDTSSVSVMEMRARARRAVADHGIQVVMIDHIQMIQSRGRPENRVQEMSAIARDLKGLAKDLRVSVVALSQLSRAAEMGGSARPQLRHLRESGELEQCADLVMFLYREAYYDPEAARKHNTTNIAELIIAKHRNGKTTTIELVFDPAQVTFRSISRRQA
jgi:replicative DNA helicase